MKHPTNRCRLPVLFFRSSTQFALAIVPVLLCAQATHGQAENDPEQLNAKQYYEKREVDRQKTTTSESATWKEPVGLALSADGSLLFVAQRRTGKLAVIDSKNGRLVEELTVGGRLEHLAAAADGSIVIPDSTASELHLLRFEGHKVALRHAIQTDAPPTSVAIASDGKVAWASLRNADAVVAYDLPAGTVRYRLELGYPPHCLALSNDGSLLLIADAYRGNVTAVSARTGAVRRQFEFPATNIRGLAFAPKDEWFYFTHQILSEKSIINRDAVFWGSLMTNNLRRVPVAEFLNRAVDPMKPSQLHYLGDANHGAGDPSEMLIAKDGTIVICLSGVGEIAIDRDWPFSFQRLKVGEHPCALTQSPGREIYVANSHGDTISRIDLASRTINKTVSLGPAPKLSAAMRGERLFHSAKLSLDGWFSCHSCHTDGHTNGNNADTIGDASFGAPKNTPSLLNVVHTSPWAWNGRFETLEAQIQSSVTNSMQGTALTDTQLADLVAYLGTLTLPPAEADKTGLAGKGKELFRARGCVRCHAGETFTSAGTYDVGLDDGLGQNREFNPPSLRNVRRTAPYFHDGRAKSLDDVVGWHQHQLDEPLSGDDREALVAYLKSL